MSDTPRTDAASRGWYPTGANDVEMVAADFARQLERELAELHASIPALIRTAVNERWRQLERGDS